MAEIKKEAGKTLSESDLEKVTGGVYILEGDTACAFFVCSSCGRGASAHFFVDNAEGGKDVCINENGVVKVEWSDVQLDCNHCSYFQRVSWQLGNCLK